MQYNVDTVLFSQWNKKVIHAKIKCGEKILRSSQRDTSVSQRILSLPFTSTFFTPLSIHQCSGVRVLFKMEFRKIGLRKVNTSKSF